MGWFCRITERLSKNWFILPVSARLKKARGSPWHTYRPLVIHNSAFHLDFRSARPLGTSGTGGVESDDLLAPDADQQDEARLRNTKIMQHVSALPEALRESVFLVYVEGFTWLEATDMLSVPIGTIMSWLATERAKIALVVHAPSPVEEKQY